MKFTDHKGHCWAEMKFGLIDRGVSELNTVSLMEISQILAMQDEVFHASEPFDRFYMDQFYIHRVVQKPLQLDFGYLVLREIHSVMYENILKENSKATAQCMFNRTKTIQEISGHENGIVVLV